VHLLGCSSHLLYASSHIWVLPPTTNP
jgi:hypothetical protein